MSFGLGIQKMPSPYEFLADDLWLLEIEQHVGTLPYASASPMVYRLKQGLDEPHTDVSHAARHLISDLVEKGDLGSFDDPDNVLRPTTVWDLVMAAPVITERWDELAFLCRIGGLIKVHQALAAYGTVQDVDAKYSQSADYLVQAMAFAESADAALRMRGLQSEFVALARQTAKRKKKKKAAAALKGHKEHHKLKEKAIELYVSTGPWSSPWAAAKALHTKVPIAFETMYYHYLLPYKKQLESAE